MSIENNIVAVINLFTIKSFKVWYERVFCSVLVGQSSLFELVNNANI